MSQNRRTPVAPQVAIALDVPDRDGAWSLVQRLGGVPRIFKVGLELFTAEGPDLIRSLTAEGHQIFLDLKLHDIPNTVAGAVSAATRLGVRWLTVHTAGGPAMLEAAARAAGDRLGLLGVTVLTSMDGAALAESLGRPGADVSQEVLRRAAWARQAGLSGVVCSVMEASLLRGVHGASLYLVTPGIRLTDQGLDDQARVATPAQAAEAGSDLLVVGRSITAAEDPLRALERVQAELDAGVPAP